MLSELAVPANPLLHQGSTETARESDAETEEPKDVYVNGKTWRFKCVKCWSVKVISIRDPRKFLSNLSKK